MANDQRRSRPAARIVLLLAVFLQAAVAPLAHTQQPGMPGMPGMPDAKGMMRWENTWFMLFEQLEYAPADASRPINFDAKTWYGGAYQRIWLRSQGEIATTRRDGEAEAEVLYGRLIDPFWDAVIGVRMEQRWRDRTTRRAQLEVGVIGLAPYRIDLEPTIFISKNGELSARLEAGFPILVTQRLIVLPEMELNAGFQPVPEFGVRRGLNDYEMGVRVRYEFRREIAPYVGWSRSRRLGATAAGVVDAPAGTRFVTGFRLWR